MRQNIAVEFARECVVCRIRLAGGMAFQDALQGLQPPLELLGRVDHFLSQ
jgi:hypothetical protein